MKPPLFIFITILTLFTVEGRLINKNKTKPIENIQPNPAIRLTRNIEEYLLSGYSREEMTPNEDFIESYNRRAKHYFRPNRTQAPNVTRTRVQRDSSEKTSTVTRTMPRIALNKRTVLVKKPIPKFIDIDYDEEFQTRINKARSLFTDFGDNEDVDFNLEDYDFDVNHDEFTSGRKPLEPRLNILYSEKEISPKTYSKIYTPPNTIHVAEEVKAVGDSIKRKEKSLEDDYVEVTTKASYMARKDSEEYSDESDDSKESDQKVLSRSTRSWNLYNSIVNESKKRVMLKHLTVLPMFPAVI